MSNVLYQADEAEVPELKQIEVDGLEVQRWAGSPGDRALTRPGVGLEGQADRYEDFALFVNFQRRFAKSLKFKNHILQPDGSFRSVEVPGPPNYDAWLVCWNVLMFQVSGQRGPHF